MKKIVRRPLWIAALLGFTCVAGVAAAFAYYVYTPLRHARMPLQFTLISGSSLKSAARQMVEAGVLERDWPFVMLARIRGEAGRLKAGNYEITEPISPLQLLRKITRGDYTQDEITLVEGWTFRQIRSALDQHPALKHETTGLSDAEIAQRAGITEGSPEGWFFPDTYYFSRGGSDLAILKRARRLMATTLHKQWTERAQGLPLTTPYEALILASLVEKETGQPAERRLVAAVLINRLRRGMRLQTDPSVIYGLGEGFDGNLRKRDLLADTPYNTYSRTGLPPTPIAIPGLAALSASLDPAPSDALYFVSKGDGTTHFSRTLGEHDRAVTKYQRSKRP